jgi:hypothetical protein
MSSEQTPPPEFVKPSDEPRSYFPNKLCRCEHEYVSHQYGKSGCNLCECRSFEPLHPSRQKASDESRHYHVPPHNPSPEFADVCVHCAREFVEKPQRDAVVADVLAEVARQETQEWSVPLDEYGLAIERAAGAIREAIRLKAAS